MLRDTVTDSNTILLVEDNPDDVLLTRWAFKHAGIVHRLVAVSDGEQAIEYLNGEGRYADRQQFPIPSIILLDLEMPKMTGFEFLGWLRHGSNMRYLPVIVLTGTLSPADLKRAYLAGANCLLAKPADLNDFALALTQLCDFWLGRCRLPDAARNVMLSFQEEPYDTLVPSTEKDKIAA